MDVEIDEAGGIDRTLEGPLLLRVRLHVDEALWPIVARAKPGDRLLLVSDALPIAGTGDGTTRLGTLDVVVHDGRATVAGTATLAGSVIALDAAVRAASSNPATLLGADDRGAIEPGRRAHLVELDDDLRVRRVTRGGGWIEV